MTTDKTPAKALFICTGNTCRSLMAEKLLEKLSADAKKPWAARSCGIAAERFFTVPAPVMKVLASHGVPEFEHVAQLVGRDLLGWADVALALTEEHRDAILDLYPEFTDKVHVLRQHVGLPDPNIEDPIGQKEEVYEACCAKIRESIEALIKKRSGETP